MTGRSLATLTTLRLGGPAAEVLTLSDPADRDEALRGLERRTGRAPVVLGHGSNVLAADAGHPGTVLLMNTRGIAPVRGPGRTVDVTVQAGHPLADLVGWAAAEGLAGVECLAGIPGTVGAAPVQNTGAYGRQLSDVLHRLTAWDRETGLLRTLPAVACRLRYRDSRFRRAPGRWVILTVTLRLTRSRAVPVVHRPLAQTLGVRPGLRTGAWASVEEVVAAVLADRHRRGLLRDRHGAEARQAGSVFLNPAVTAAAAARWSALGCPVHPDPDGRPRVSAGWLLEHVGHRPGSPVAEGIRCSARRALTLTVHDGATATGFARALDRLAHQVEAATGVVLRPEPVRIGAWA
ncbi:UDP-N-acetylmuramate dehydrogenase [Kitasatospora sp. NPDC096147]|uniref:UDP-N-acetylmuramate dehydrogenase n=1 Tax=Kitasatospora sp. NPDC096147 TaxID=3364093 RepID=UPI00380670FB